MSLLDFFGANRYHVARCSYCGSHGHPTSHCPKTAAGQGNLAALRCGYCGGRDHNTEACPKLGRRPGPGGVLIR